MARPCKNNPEWKQKKQAFEQAKENGKLQKFFEALKWWLSRSSAMAYSGLPMSSVYAWIEQDANFKREIEHCEEYRVAIVENEKRKKNESGAIYFRYYVSSYYGLSFDYACIL